MTQSEVPTHPPFYHERLSLLHKKVKSRSSFTTVTEYTQTPVTVSGRHCVGEKTQGTSLHKPYSDVFGADEIAWGLET